MFIAKLGEGYKTYPSPPFPCITALAPLMISQAMPFGSDRIDLFEVICAKTRLSAKQTFF